jgi:integrase
MACVYNRGTKAKPNYWVNWREHGRNKYARVGPDHAEAKAVATKIEADLRARRLRREHRIETQPLPPVPVFNAAADAWLKMRSAVGPDRRPAFRAWRDDQTRLKLHLRPLLGARHLDEITVDDVLALIEKMRPTHRPQTIRNTLHTLSRLYEDQPKAMRLVNPVRQLGRSDRKRIGEGWDPQATPWLRSDEHVRRVYNGFPEMAPGGPWQPMFALGVFAGLRPGEIRSIQWGDLDFAARLIHVQRSDDGPVKDGEARTVPLSPALAEVLLQWKEVSEPPQDAPSRPCFFIDGQRVRKEAMLAALTAAFAAATLPRLTWYQATRHTYGGRFVSNGGSLERLRLILGHSSTEVTQRYGHLVRDQFSDAERAMVDVQLQPGKVLPLRASRGG